MNRNTERRGWVLVAAIAIGIALLCLLALHAQSADSGWLAILPLALAGVISPLALLPRIAFFYLGPMPAAPLLPASFQRPPPICFA
jgi:hypothetical protein